MRWARFILQRLGWSTNTKCVWEPSTEADFMGLLIDSAKFIVKVTERRIEKARALMLGINGQVKRTGGADTQLLRSLVGQLIAMTLAIPAAPAFTRGLYDTIVGAERAGMEEAKLTAEAIEELDFWPLHLKCLNGAPIRNRAETAVICVDASEQGIGATCGDMRLAEPLPAELIGKSSTLRELYGVLRAVQVWGGDMKGQHVRIVMDSLPAARNLIKGGGQVTELCGLVKSIWKETHGNGITYAVTWVERERNTEADHLSKKWEGWHLVTQEAYRRIIEWLQLKQIGRVPIRNPPFNKVKEEIQAARADGIRVCVVHPCWPAQIWWPAVKDKQSIELGWAAEVLAGAANQSAAHPRWRIWATVV